MNRTADDPVPLPSPLEEAVLTWLAGAALVSGATRLSAFVDSPSRRLTLVDDGAGLPARGFSRCHGFCPSLRAGASRLDGAARTMGAAIRPALLVAGTATVESRRDGRRAIRFALGKGGKVLVRQVRPRGLVPGATGTAVTLLFPGRSSPLLDAAFVKDRMLKRFSSLMGGGDHAPGVVTISVDGKTLVPPPPIQVPEPVVQEPAVQKPAAAAREADLAGELNATVELILRDYPELAPVVGACLPEPRGPQAVEERADAFGAGKQDVFDSAAVPGKRDVFDSADVFGGTAPPPNPPPPEAKATPEPSAKRPSITVGWEEDPTRDKPGRMEETTLILNRLHPAWEAAKRDGALAYHAAICLALALSRSIAPGKQVDDFISRFLDGWGITRT